VIIDISEQVFARFQYRELPEKNTMALSIKKQMISWLIKNVGEYYGEVEQNRSRVYTGAGWEWGTRQETVYVHAYAVGKVQTTWFVKIDDEAAATMFRLKFL
jgi:hypothetical protein